VAYTEWGSPHNPHAVICVHGLTRNSRDFDYLAARLAADCRVVCIDVPGRGASDWLTDKSDYGFALYQSDAATLLAHVLAHPGGMLHDLAGALRHGGRPERVDWVGTSMGGLIGMMMAAKPGSPIGRRFARVTQAAAPSCSTASRRSDSGADDSSCPSSRVRAV